MIARLDSQRQWQLPYSEKLGFTKKLLQPQKGLFQKTGSIWISFRFLARKGSSAMRAHVEAENFGETAAAMLTANEDAAIRAFGAALQSHTDPTIQACGQILTDQRKLVETAAPQTVAA